MSRIHGKFSRPLKNFTDFLTENPKCTEYLTLDEYKKVRERTQINSNCIRRSINIDNYLPNYVPKKKSEEKKAKFYGHCPKDDCTGILNKKYKCLLCQSNVCNRCMVIKDEGKTHKCDEEVVKTIKLLRKEVKPCPNPGCGVPIYKIAGCYQMFCTQCHILFEWKTLKILKERAHNPHAIEWMNRTGNRINEDREPNLLCGGVITVNRYRKIGRTALYNYCQTYTIDILKKMNHMERIAGHLRGTLLDELNRKLNSFEQEFYLLDRKFLTNKITPKGYRRSLGSKEKQREALKDTLDALNIFVEQMDYIYSVYGENVNCFKLYKDFNSNGELHELIKKEAEKAWNFVDELIDYINTILKQIGTNYKLSHYYIVRCNSSLDTKVGIVKVKANTNPKDRLEVKKRHHHHFINALAEEFRGNNYICN